MSKLLEVPKSDGEDDDASAHDEHSFKNNALLNMSLDDSDMFKSLIKVDGQILPKIKTKHTNSLSLFKKGSIGELIVSKLQDNINNKIMKERETKQMGKISENVSEASLPTFSDESDDSKDFNKWKYPRTPV